MIVSAAAPPTPTLWPHHVISSTNQTAQILSVSMTSLPNANRPGQNSRIAFGSCNDQDLQNDLWPIIVKRRPAGFIWGGDAIYADVQHPRDWSSFPPKPEFTECGTPERVRQLYQDQLQVSGYQLLKKQNITIFGTIDDHDYGCNNADKTFEHKYETTQAFVEFLGIDTESAMAKRTAAGYGVYGVQLFDFDRSDSPAIPDFEAEIDPDLLFGNHNLEFPHYNQFRSTSSYEPGNKTVAVFVLDVRTNKDPWKATSSGSSTGTFEEDHDGDFLGEKQWKWFETAISNSPAAVNVVVTGLQVQADIFQNPNVAESWTRFPKSQERLFNALLNSEGVPILVSGDVHMTQFMRMDCEQFSFDESSKDEGVARQQRKPPRRSLVEMTTSGMTHSWGSPQSKPLQQDSSFEHSSYELFEAFIARNFMRLLHHVNPWTSILEKEERETVSSRSAKTGLQYSLEKNFGELEFNWEQQSVVLRTIGESGEPLLEHSFSFDALSGHKGRGLQPAGLSYSDFREEFQERTQRKSHHDSDADWICLPHRGRVSVARKVWGHITVVVIILCASLMSLLIPTVVFKMVFTRVYQHARRQPKKTGLLH